MYRYWDGHAWSAVLSANPSAPPPSSGIGQPGTPAEQQQYGDQGGYGSQASQPSAYQTYQQIPKKRSVVGWWIGGIALLVVIILVAFTALRGLGGGGTIDDPFDPGGGPSQDPCPTTQTQPSADTNHPNDGRVHGGPVSYPLLPAPWEAPAGDNRVPFGSDVQVQQITIEHNYQPGNNWVASILVAELMAGDGFFTPEQGAEIVAKCVEGEFYGDNPVEREDIESKAMKVDGHEAWYLEAHLSFDIEGLQAKGETMIIVIVNAGASSGLYYASIPDNAKQYLADAEKSLEQLKVDS
jgi:hypothetical protein